MASRRFPLPYELRRGRAFAAAKSMQAISQNAEYDVVETVREQVHGVVPSRAD